MSIRVESSPLVKAHALFEKKRSDNLELGWLKPYLAASAFGNKENAINALVDKIKCESIEEMKKNHSLCQELAKMGYTPEEIVNKNTYIIFAKVQQTISQIL